MPETETQCTKTCRDLRPGEPETWCAGCTTAEAVDREGNYLRWRASETRREVLDVVRERLERETAK